MKESVFNSFPWCSWAILDLNQRPRPINRFLFGSDSSFPNAAYNYPLYCALQVGK
ncbi:hypothetical protein AHAS_Ahas06G0271300 [Arachis hypogaea]